MSVGICPRALGLSAKLISLDLALLIDFSLFSLLCELALSIEEVSSWYVASFPFICLNLVVLSSPSCHHDVVLCILILIALMLYYFRSSLFIGSLALCTVKVLCSQLTSNE